LSATVTRLRVKDEDFLVAAMIERCPKTMMIRELVKNALEAAETAPEGERRVELSAVPVDGVPKLAIWNTGRGLTGPELYRMCDIAASIRKETGLDRNFGMGAKVASLPSNQAGLRYRSARKGTVQEVMMGKYDGTYGRLLRPGARGVPTEVVIATAEAEAEGRSATGEWTEVMLFGNRPEQNTVTDPYDGNPRSAPFWLVEAVRLRFFRFPAGTEIVFRKGVARLAEDRKATSLAERLAALPRYEAVRTPEGITIHYAFNPALLSPEANAAQSVWEGGEGMAGIVYRDELYSVVSGAAWLREAPSFGISFLARAITVVVELPDDFPVLSDAYREFLRHQTSRQEQVRVQDTAALVTHHQPAWLTSLMAEAVPRADYVDEVLAEMRDMLEKLGVARRRPGRGFGNLARPAPPPGGLPAEPRPVRIETTPTIMLLRDPAEIADRGLTYRAATYYAETHQLHVNLQYPIVTEAAQALAATAPLDLDIEGVQIAARMAAERAMVSRIARALVHSFAKRGRPREWSEGNLRVLISPEALTLAADDLAPAWEDATQAFAKALESVPPAQAEPAAEG